MVPGGGAGVEAELALARPRPAPRPPLRRRGEGGVHEHLRRLLPLQQTTPFQRSEGPSHIILPTLIMLEIENKFQEIYIY